MNKKKIMTMTVLVAGFVFLILFVTKQPIKIRAQSMDQDGLDFSSEVSGQQETSSLQTQTTPAIEESFLTSTSDESNDDSTEETISSTSSVVNSSEESIATTDSTMIPETTFSSTETEQQPELIMSSHDQEFIESSSFNEEIQETNTSFRINKNLTTQEFVDTIASDAQLISWKQDLYASVMIAQAILETGSGSSSLSQQPNYNLFGIKGSYRNQEVIFLTQEDSGNGQMYTIKSAFRKYPSYKESLEDYAELLKKGIRGNPSFYQATWKKNTTSYREATSYLTGRYATDSQYDRKLNALIETYQLDKYDQNPEVDVLKNKKSTNDTKKNKHTNENEKTYKLDDRIQPAGKVLPEESVDTYFKEKIQQPKDWKNKRAQDIPIDSIIK